MTVQFEDREKAREAKFAHDEELAFKANARRNKLIGHWVAKQMGLSGAQADAYALSVSQSEASLQGPDAVLAHLLKDIRAKGIGISEHRLHQQMETCLVEARQQIMSELTHGASR